MTETLQVALAERSYNIVIGHGLLEEAGHYIAPKLASERAIIVTDSEVGPLYAQGLQAALQQANVQADVVTVPAGESSKSFAGFESLMNDLLALTPDRKTTLIALGGGVVGDLTGYAAASLLRGVPFIQVPTSLLAQVDSSVGGKTGINAPAGKNLVGAFYQPQLVLIDTATLGTLPERELQAGYAEVVKYGLIYDEAFFNWLEKNGKAVTKLKAAELGHAIKTSCSIKAEMVRQDEREGGIRALLNLGHTFGHALEAETGYGDALLHGEAVAIGMVLAARLSAQMQLGDGEMETRIVKHLQARGLPVSPKQVRDDWDVDALMEHVAHDKKNEGGALTFVLLKAIGAGAVIKNVSPDAVRRVWEEAIS
ncbi:MAG: 3-dehydroquinate synthase [Rickettsiales bacterium]|nr:3-dehydroquinate synthase [Rickettsiales bacterium]